MSSNGLLIIGNGVAGVTLARMIRKQSDMPIRIISEESDHFFSRPALMYIYMGHMRYQDTKPYEDWFWEKNKIELTKDLVTSVDLEKKSVSTKKGDTFSWDKLVFATGSKSNFFGWPGQDLPGVQALYSLGDLELLEKNTKNCKHAVIVGGGLIGVELAEMLHTRGIGVTFLVREKSYWTSVLPLKEANIVAAHVESRGIELKLETNLKEIIAGENGRVAKVSTVETDEEIDCQLVGITAGVHPRTELAKETGVNVGRGIVVNEYMETETADVYAIGDCAEIREAGEEKGRVEPLWYTGKMQAETLSFTICGNRKKYERGIWFNSAKFFDLEYQTYGLVPTDPGESIYWEDPKSERAIRIVYNPETRAVTGFNVLGIRLRQETCQAWIEDERTIDDVIEKLEQANFDPEFFANWSKKVNIPLSSAA